MHRPPRYIPPPPPRVIKDGLFSPIDILVMLAMSVCAMVVFAGIAAAILEGWACH